MEIRVKFFAILREKVGRAEVVERVPDDTTVADLWRFLQGQYDALSAVNIRLVYAVNGDYVQASQVLRDGDEVVFVPPVSGGR